MCVDGNESIETQPYSFMCRRGNEDNELKAALNLFPSVSSTYCNATYSQGMFYANSHYAN